MLNVVKNGQGRLDYCESTLFYLFAIVILLVAQFFVGVIAAALGNVVPDIAENGEFNTACMIFFQVVNAAFILVFFKLKKYKLNFSPVKSKKSGRGVTAVTVILPIVAAAVLMVGMYLPTVWFGYLTEVMGVPPEAGSIDIETPSAGLVMLVISSVFLAPPCEEFIYRGVLLHGLREEKSAVKAVLLSALAFMLMHISPFQIVFQFALGVLGAIIVLRTGRLFPSVILHAASNALAIVVEFTPLAKTLNSCVTWLVAHVGVAFAVTLGLFVCAGGIVFLIVKFGLKEKSAVETPTADEEEPSAELEQDKQALVLMRKRNGTMWLYIGIGICVLMLIINTVTLIIS